MRRRIALLTALLCAALAGEARATDYPVTLGPDEEDFSCSDGDCGLRDALFVAGPTDRVILPVGTLSLIVGAEMDGDHIVGAGARLSTIEALGASIRPLEANAGVNTVSGVTLTGGEWHTLWGGGILVNEAELTLSDSTVRDNMATNGGGVANLGGTLRVERSTISGNTAFSTGTAASGGGVWTSGTAAVTTIVDSTISGNDVDNDGGSGPGGGGAYVQTGTMNVTGSTIAGNLAAPSTAVGAGSPLSTTVSFSHTILPGSCSRVFSSSASLFTDASCGAQVVGPLLGFLADNGGPTDTHALTPGSPAVDAGTSCSPTDQRGVARVGACDIGAYELASQPPPPPPPPPSPADDTPVAGESVDVEPAGTVKIKRPGTNRFVTLTEDGLLPVGTIVDTLRGSVVLKTAGGGSARFFDGIFKIAQGKGAKPLTILTLVEKLTCTAKKAGAAAKKKTKRRLWGDGKGRFQIEGQAQRGDRRGHEVARGGHVHDDAHTGGQRPRLGPRLRQEEDRDRQGGQALHSAGEEEALTPRLPLREHRDLRLRKGLRAGLVGVAAAVALLCGLPAVASAQVGVVNTTNDPLTDNNCTTDTNGCTLRDAVNDPDISIVHVPSGTYVLGTQGELTFLHDVRVEGTGPGMPTIRTDVEIPHRVMLVSPTAEVELSRLRITGGFEPNDNGGGILIDSGGILFLNDSEVSENRAVGGGGIYATGELHVTNSLIAFNRAETIDGDTGIGGGVAIGPRIGPDPVPAALVNVTLSNNLTDGVGGGLHTRRAASLISVSIVENSAPARSVGTPGPKGAGLFQDFTGDGDAVTFARSTLLARNGDANCGGTATDPVDSIAGMIDELALPSCNVINQDPTVNFVVADARVAVLAGNGGLTFTHALLADSPAIDKGVVCPQDDQRGVARPQGAACDIGAYELVVSQPPSGGGQPPPPPPPEDEELPPPVAGKNVNVEPTGTVKIKLPGTNRFVTLAEDEQLPVGTIVDTLKGSVVLKTAGGGSAKFFDGIFKISQGTGAKPLTILTLVEKLTCTAKKAGAAAKKKTKRRLWGDGKGRFQTKGKHSAATVVGTKWLVEDTCTTTRTKVTKGKVSVRDFVKKKTVTVKAGKEYIAKARP